MFENYFRWRFQFLLQGTSLLMLLGVLIGCAGSPAEDVSFDLSIAKGVLLENKDTFLAKQDDRVTLDLSSDTYGEIHLHGYDLMASVGPGAPSSISFVAHATGRFSIEFHHNAEAESYCDVDVTGMAISLAVDPGAEAGLYLISVETEMFEISLASGNHWHLTSDGKTVGMIYDLSTEVDLGLGTHQVMAQLNTAEHCDLPVSAVVMVGQDGVADGMTAGNEAANALMVMDQHVAGGGHAHESDEEPVYIGSLEIRPR